MNPLLKKFLIISGKQAVGVLFGNAALAAALPKVFNFHDAAGLIAFAKLTGTLVLAAEAKVWIPKLLSWANSPTNGS